MMRSLLMALILGISSSLPAVGATLSHTQPFSETVLVTAPPDVVDASTPISADLPRFDPSLGTLNEVFYESESYFQVDVTVPADGTGEGHGNVGGAYSVDGIQFTGFGNGTFVGGTAGSAGSETFSGQFSVIRQHTFTSGPAFDAFIGTGDATLLYDALTDLEVAGDVASSQLLLLDTSFMRVTYDYTPVPEPSSAVLAGLAVFGLAAFAYRRGRSRRTN